MDYIIIILGLIISTIGFAFAFSGINPYYFENHYEINHLDWATRFLLAYSNLLSGLIIGIGGIAIAITGELYRPRLYAW